MQRWARTDIRQEILEQFCDPRWFGLAANDLCFSPDLRVTTENTNWRLLTRKTDTDRKERVLEAASARPVWCIDELHKLLPGLTTVEIGLCLSQSSDWSTRWSDKIGKRWFNITALTEWLEKLGVVKLSQAATMLDIQPRTLSRLLKAHDPNWVVTGGLLVKRGAQ